MSVSILTYLEVFYDIKFRLYHFFFLPSPISWLAYVANDFVYCEVSVTGTRHASLRCDLRHKNSYNVNKMKK